MPLTKEQLRLIWDRWRTKYPWDVLKRTFPFPQNLISLYDWWTGILHSRGVDIDEYDFEAYLDPTLTRKEHEQLLETLITAPPGEEMYEAWAQEAINKIQDEAREAGLLEPYEKKIRSLERTEKKSKRKYEKAKELEDELRRELREKEGEVERLKLTKKVTVKFTRDYPSFVGYDLETYGPFKTGELTSLPEANAAILIEQKVASIWGIPKIEKVLPVMPPRELTKEEKKRLQDVFNAALFDGLGRIPASTISKFRVELEKIKDLSYVEAEKRILELAQEIVGMIIATKKIVPARPPRKVEVYRPPREEDELYAMPHVSPAEPPEWPLEPPVMKFPRSPSSREEQAFWKAFQYKLQTQGFNPWEWQREFNNYISKMQFRSWKALVKAYELFVETIKEKKELPPLWQWSGVPPPSLNYLPKELEKKRAGAIIHYTSVLIRNARRAREPYQPTLEELREDLGDIMGITNVTFDEIKTALMEAYKEKDVRLIGITLEELNNFLEAT